jgi:hypothetical protein
MLTILFKNFEFFLKKVFTLIDNCYILYISEYQIINSDEGGTNEWAVKKEKTTRTGLKLL